MATATTENSSFAQAFAAAAHHFYPDGCPRVQLQDVWPRRNDRNPVAAGAALASIQQDLPHYVQHDGPGLTLLEMEAVMVVALATLPVIKTKTTTAPAAVTIHQSSSVGVGSPLVDGSSRHFQSLLRTCIPKRDEYDDTHDDADTKPNYSSTTSATDIIIINNKRILDTLLSHRARMDAPARCALLQWVTLMLRNYYSYHDHKSVHHNLLLQTIINRRYEPIWMQFALSPETCADAVRLLLHLFTTSFPIASLSFRAQQFGACWDAAQSSHPGIQKRQKQLQPLLALLQLYARLDPDKSIVSSRDGPLADDWIAGEEWFSFPDPDWARAFENPQDDTNAVSRRPHKRARVSSSSAELDAFLVRLPQFLLPPSSFTFFSGMQQTASAVAKSPAVRYAVVLSGNQAGRPTGSRHFNNSYHCWTTQLRHNLPYLLYEEWYSEYSAAARHHHQSDDDNSHGGSYHQRALLESLAYFVRHTGWLLPEMEHFLLRHVLPIWSDDPIVLYDLIPALSSSSSQHNSVSAFRALVWQHLEPMFVYNSNSSGSLQYAIVAGALTGLVYRWGGRNQNTDENDNDENESHKNKNMKLLQRLIPWTEELLTKGFLLASSNHELLSAAAYEFYSAVAHVTDQQFLGAPDAALTYRLLLSSSAFSVDLVCQLLARYKALFERLVQETGLDDDDDILLNERIELFNSFVSDFGSVLWRCTHPPMPLSADVDDRALQDDDNKSILFTDLFLRPTTQYQIYVAGAVVAPTLSVWKRDILVSYKMDWSHGDDTVEYLDYLKDRWGLQGLHEFLHTFVGPLVQRRQELMQE